MSWHQKCTASELELSASLCGRLYEDVQNCYIWKTKWGIPPTLIKVGPTINSPAVEPEHMTFEIHLVETTSDRNAFVVLPDGIRGQSRKPATNNFCEFKGLKLTCNE